MRYAIFGTDGRVLLACNDATIDALPDGAIQLSAEQWGTRFSLLLQDGALVEVPAVIPLDQMRQAASERIDAACRESIYAGFESVALGDVHNYPANDKDQTNLIASVTASLYPSVPVDWLTPFWCADANGVWGYRAHTASQIQQVGWDGKAAIVAALTKNAGLQAQIIVAETAIELDAIQW